MASPSELTALRSAHGDLAVLRARAAHEQATVAGLGQVADERRADLVRASQDREAIDQLRARALERHALEGARQEAIVMDGSPCAAPRARAPGWPPDGRCRGLPPRSGSGALLPMMRAYPVTGR